MGESGIFYVQFWSLQNLVWGLERTTLNSGDHGLRMAKLQSLQVRRSAYGARSSAPRSVWHVRMLLAVCWMRV